MCLFAGVRGSCFYSHDTRSRGRRRRNKEGSALVSYNFLSRMLTHTYFMTLDIVRKLLHLLHMFQSDGAALLWRILRSQESRRPPPHPVIGLMKGTLLLLLTCHRNEAIYCALPVNFNSYVREEGRRKNSRTRVKIKDRRKKDGG